MHRNSVIVQEYVYDNEVVKIKDAKKPSSVNINNFMGVLGHFLVVVCSIQIISKINVLLFPYEPELPADDIFMVKEYELKVSDLAKLLQTNETLLLPESSEDGNLIRQSFQILFQEIEGQAPAISIISSLFLADSSSDDKVNQSSHFSTVKINLNNNKPYPSSVQFFSGVKKNVKNESELKDDISLE